MKIKVSFAFRNKRINTVNIPTVHLFLCSNNIKDTTQNNKYKHAATHVSYLLVNPMLTKSKIRSIKITENQQKYKHDMNYDVDH